MNRFLRPRRALLAALILLAGCGGGGGDDHVAAPPADCSLQSQKAWLRDYMSDAYFWYRSSPSPDPSTYASVEAYFSDLLYQGADPAFPFPDRWSYSQPTAQYERFFGEGRTLGYGVFVAGLEVQGQPQQPLYVRYVEPQSPAGLAGVRRGDRILAVNGRPAEELIAANDYAALTPGAAGETLTLALRGEGGDRSVSLSAAVYALTPVSGASVIELADGRRMGYLKVKDMVPQVQQGLETAFAQFRSAGVSELALDLRYNGGGLVSVARLLASHVAGWRAADQTFATLLYNDRKSANNTSYAFSLPSNALGLPRVYVLAGPRTCSASEQVVNGLRPFVDVVLVGDTTCGKPVGFLPESACGTTYSAVNFETVNARNEGRYFDGFDPSGSCAVTEDFSVALGLPREPLLAAARAHAVTGSCPQAAGTGREKALSARLRGGGRRIDEGEHPAMIPR